MKKHKRILILLLCVALIVCGAYIPYCARKDMRYFEGAALEYYNGLLTIGFPADYAEELTELHLLHPNWNFIPLDILSTDSTFTWERVIEGETDEPDVNLVSPASAYRPYRHPRNDQTYDSGYYQASTATVKYFMDPRNFLNEADIFQFFDLSSATGVSLHAVEAVLRGTFMENGVLENGMTYAQAFLQIGAEVGVNPVFLAVRARQEQGGSGASPIMSGVCGTTLIKYYREYQSNPSGGNPYKVPSGSISESELRALDGYYNIFNIGASGNGTFSICRNAMEYAKKGSAEMASAWGGNASWDTVWKSIYGGALVLKRNYVDAYKSTVYLQKFNVHGAANANFRNQYMQNVAGAMSESRLFYQTFASIDTLDESYTFLIPVYSGMPSKPCADPANGKCPYVAPADTKYSMSVSLSGANLKRKSDDVMYASFGIWRGGALHLQGAVEHSYGVTGLEYSIDGITWTRISENGELDLSLIIDFSKGSTHILMIRGLADYRSGDSARMSNRHFLCAVLYITVT